MAKYTLTSDQEPCGIVRDDGACIPPDPANVDYAEYLAWKETGGTPDPVADDPRKAVLAEIAYLESTITPRRMREAAIGGAGLVWLTDVDSQITALRTQL